MLEPSAELLVWSHLVLPLSSRILQARHGGRCALAAEDGRRGRVVGKPGRSPAAGLAEGLA